MRFLGNAVSIRSFLRAKRFLTADISFLLFLTVFALGKMLVEIKSKFKEEIFELKKPLRAENSAQWKMALRPTLLRSRRSISGGSFQIHFSPKPLKI